MKDKRIEVCLIVAVAVLFFFSAIAPMVIGYKVETTDAELDKLLDNLRFICTDANGFSEEKYEYYKEKLLSQYSSESSNDDIVIEPKIEEAKILIESPSSPASGSGPMNSPWPMQSHDTHHTGQSPYSTADNPGIEKWRFYMDGWMEDTPVIDSDGIIYFGGCYGGLPWYLFAVYPNGTEKWKYKTGGLILESSPAIDEDGTICVGSWDCNLYAISPDGTLKWKIGAGGSIASSPAIAEDGTIYFGTMSSGNSIVAVSSNGTLKWSYKTGASIVSDPAVGDDGTVYIGSQDHYLYAMNSNGTLKWRFKTGDWVSGNPTIAEDGTIYIGSFDDYFYAVNPDGTEKWKFNSGVGTSNSASIGDDGTIYVATDHLYARNPNGTEKWSFDFGGYCGCKSSPAVSADGTIYVGLHKIVGDGGKIIAVNPDGTEKWEKTIAQYWVYSSPSIAEDGTVYTGSAYDIASGYLHAFGPVESNSPPGIPTISGETYGEVGTEYKYEFTAVDPDNNPLSYYIDWADGTITDWTREYASGETAKIKHTFNQQGTFKIKAKARDTLGEEGDWGYLEVTMPKNKQISQQSSIPLFLQILQRILNTR